MDLDFDDQPSDHVAPAGNWGFLLSTLISFMTFCFEFTNVAETYEFGFNS